MAIVIYNIYGEVFTLTMENRDGSSLGNKVTKIFYCEILLRWIDKHHTCYRTQKTEKKENREYKKNIPI